MLSFFPKIIFLKHESTRMNHLFFCIIYLHSVQLRQGEIDDGIM